MAADNTSLASVIIARSNQAAVRALAEKIAARAADNPFCRRVVLVDHRAIGMNLIAELAAASGLVVAVSPTPVEEFIASVTAAVERAGDPALPTAPLPLSHHAVALAVCAALSRATGRAALQQIEDALSHALPDRKIALATEAARSLDAAMKSRVNLADCEPWVADLVAVLEAHANAVADGRLAASLSRWKRARQAADQLATDASLRDRLIATGELPDHVFGFDLSVPPAGIAAVLATFGRAIPITIVSVNPVEQTPACPVAKGWGERSLHPVEPLAEALGATATVLPPEGAASPTSSLNAVQDLLRGRPVAAWTPASTDHSLGIHLVPSRYRAAEICRDLVHRAIEEIPGLLLEDIVVLTDDPRTDAPFIDAAFKAVVDERIDPTITALNTRDRDIAVDAFLTALQLGRSSFTAGHVFGLVAMPPVAEVLGLAADEVDKLAEACRHVGLRAYVDQAHRAAAIGSFSASDAGTWSAALDSLAASLAIPDGGHTVIAMDGTAPGGGLHAQDAHLLAALDMIIVLLTGLNTLATGGTPPDMTAAAKELLDLLLPDRGGWAKTKRVIEAAIDAAEADAAAAGFTGQMDFLWFRDDLARRVNRLGSGVLARHGGVSVLTPAQARGRAVKVAVAILSDRFPTEDRPMWPLPMQPQRPGDSCQWDADQRDFFAAFVHATHRFAIVAPAICPRTRQPLPVSSIVHDLRSAAHTALSGNIAHIEHEESVAAHSLSARSGSLPTRHAAAIKAAQALHDMRSGTRRDQIFPVLDRQVEIPTQVTVEEFIRFFEDPVKAFLKHRRVFVEDIEEAQPIREMLEASHLDRWKMRDRIFGLLRDQAAGKITTAQLRQLAEDACNRFLREGLVHEGPAGVSFIGDQVVVARALVNALKNGTGVVGMVPADVSVSYNAHGVTHTLSITGSVYFNGQNVVWPRIGSFRGKDAVALVVLDAIVKHKGTPHPCVVAALKGDNVDLKDLAKRPAWMGQNGVLPSLKTLARLWHIGLQLPLPLFPAAAEKSFGPAKNLNASPYVPDAAEEFTKKDFGFGGGEGSEANVSAAFRGLDPLRSSQSGSTGPNESDFVAIARFLAGLDTDPFPGGTI
jgi:exonuclease V gamma subunit